MWRTPRARTILAMSTSLPTSHRLPDGSMAVLRRARPEDRPVVGRLSALDSERALFGDVILGEVDGRLVSAGSLLDGRVVADPFTLSGPVAELVRAHVDAARSASGTRRARGRSRATARVAWMAS